MKRILMVTAMALALQGCFAVVPVPGPVMGSVQDAITGEHGEHCVPGIAKVGDKITLPDGKLGTITEISGPSSRCMDASRPIRATIAS